MTIIYTTGEFHNMRELINLAKLKGFAESVQIYEIHVENMGRQHFSIPMIWGEISI